MKIKIFLLLFMFKLSYSQNNFQNGYYISNDNKKIECLIKNFDWKNIPNSFEVKENGLINTIGLVDAKEVVIDGVVKFVRAKVNIDLSSDNLQQLDSKSEPKFGSKNVFLKVLIEGNYDLYYYIDTNIPSRFFYRSKEGALEQLIYKQYIDEEESKLKENNQFKQQLLNNVNCNNSMDLDVNKLNYNESDLIDYFISQNNCGGKSANRIVSRERKFKYSISPLVSVIDNNIKLNITQNSLIGEHNMEPQKNISFGFEYESIFPFNHYTWSFYIQPKYVTKYSDSKQFYFSQFLKPNINLSLQYNHLEMPIGIRKYILLNNKSSIFFNLGYNYFYTFNSSTINITDEKEINIGSTFNGNLTYGMGFKYKKIGLEFNTGIPVNYNLNEVKVKYTYGSLLLKYNLFSNKDEVKK